MSNLELVLTILICAAVTLALRVLPFILFPGGKQPPKFITWLGGQLPRAVMAMLVVYCLKNVQFTTGTADWLPALAACAITAILHVWRKQIVLSICGGTAVYMILIRLIV